MCHVYLGEWYRTSFHSGRDIIQLIDIQPELEHSVQGRYIAVAIYDFHSPYVNQTYICHD